MGKTLTNVRNLAQTYASLPLLFVPKFSINFQDYEGLYLVLKGSSLHSDQRWVSRIEMPVCQARVHARTFSHLLHQARSGSLVVFYQCIAKFTWHKGYIEYSAAESVCVLLYTHFCQHRTHLIGTSTNLFRTIMSHRLIENLPLIIM